MEAPEKHTERTTHSERQDDDNQGDLARAQAANTQEHQLTFWKAVQAYPKAICWSVLLSTAIVMEGYDTKLIGSLQAQPAFRKNYGVEVKPGSYQVTAPWQAGLGNGATVGQCLGLALVGIVTDRFGFKRTNMISLLLMVAFIFIPFFAPSIEVLLVGQILCGIPWGVFQTLSTAYAVEVCPLHLRGYLSTYVNLCWVFGQFIAAGVLRGVATRTDQWAYRIPFAVQWVWPIPLAIGSFFAPESPWWCIRNNRITEAKHNLNRLLSSRDSVGSHVDIDEVMELMKVTVAQEKEAGTGTHYTDCFKKTDLRRTLITCAVWGMQILSGTGLRVYSTYFYEQAGLATTQAFNMSLIQYALAVVGVWIAWAILPHFGRRTLYIWGLSGLGVTLLVIGGLGCVNNPSSSVSWATGSMLLFYTVIYDITIGPICYSLVSEIPSSRLRSKSIALARITYQLLNIVFGTLTPYMLNPSKWDMGAKTGFVFAGTCLLSLITTIFFVPETKDRSYAELNILFHEKVPAWRFKGTVVDITEGITRRETSDEIVHNTRTTAES